MAQHAGITLRRIIEEQLRHNPYITYEELHQKAKQEYGASVSDGYFYTVRKELASRGTIPKNVLKRRSRRRKRVRESGDRALQASRNSLASRLKLIGTIASVMLEEGQKASKEDLIETLSLICQLGNQEACQGRSSLKTESSTS